MGGGSCLHPLALPPVDFYDIVNRRDKIFFIIIFNACFVIFSASDTTVKELKSLALELGIDTSKCIEKSDLVSVIKNVKNEEAAEDHYENATNEKATLNQHEKKKRRRSTKIHESMWYSCNRWYMLVSF